ncbi:hypothetical protein SBA5_490063 [Candidatus Sulfotelmatomonas gaucii]|uniref:Uncharacterized protein n=1 Tax=Candidatus Sulfuritelmatomonas gaucii TaxID=2043161 RepID=A0A2N9LPX1_9BACT|nr:hypothetical protein SBA5_490063 [Candidatus Sulfotelmatomonas gaucii]
MSSVLDYRKCPQCKFEQADFEYNCRTFEEYLQCRMCGYCEVVDREIDNEGKVTYKHKINEGAGALFYRWQGAIGYTSYFLSTQEEVTEAEQWLREKLAAGQVRPSSAYVSRWDKETRSVEFVIGRLFEFSNYDPDDEIPEQKGPSDLRPFQLVEQRYQAKLRYSCGHILESWILLLQGQPAPAATAILRTDVPCLACLPKFISGAGDFSAEELATVCSCRTRLWENRWIDGSGEYVTPAFDHPQSLEEAASRFYAAYPERKQCHPESMGFHLQCEGWSDEEIAAKKWLCDCAGCRAKPMSLGCMRSRR